MVAERVGFEPTCRLRDKTLSRRPRYDHFGTSPHRQDRVWPQELPIIPAPHARLRTGRGSVSAPATDTSTQRRTATTASETPPPPPGPPRSARDSTRSTSSDSPPTASRRPRCRGRQRRAPHYEGCGTSA